MSLIHGFDISAFQGTSVPTADFIFIKATEGKSYTSSKFKAQWADAKKKGLIRGAYHFARPEQSSASSQADRFLATVKPQSGDLVALDLEASGLNQAKTNAWAKAFGDRLREKTPGIKTVLYMGHGYSSNGTGKDLSQHFDLWWYPQYPSAKATSKWPASFSPWIGSPNNTGWDKPHIWQFSSAFAGVDANVSWLSKSDLVKSTPKPAAPKPSSGGSVSNNTAPSWDAVHALLVKQKATYAKGRTGENVNDYTRWYGMNGPFCFMGISWTLAHAGSSEKAGLDLIGGKKAYVPYIRNIKGYHAGHSGMKVGAIVAVNSFNHIGFCTKISGSSFELFSFNTTHNGSDDAVWNKTYPLSYASGYVNLAYGSASEEEDGWMQYVSVDKTDKSRKEELLPEKWHQIHFNQNNSGDAPKHHSNGDYPSLLLGPCYYMGTVTLRIKDLPKGVEGQIRAMYVDMDSKPKAHCDIDEFLGSEGDTFVKTHVSGYVPKGQKMRIEVVQYGSAVTDPNAPKPTVIAGWARLHVR